MLRHGALTPTIWSYEIRNILLVCVKRGRLDRRGLLTALGTLRSLPIKVAGGQDWPRIMRLSAEHNLTIYDAAYLELALRSDGRLATFDKALAAAAEANNVLART